jgi:hypothetical protein
LSITFLPKTYNKNAEIIIAKTIVHILLLIKNENKEGRAFIKLYAAGAIV